MRSLPLAGLVLPRNRVAVEISAGNATIVGELFLADYASEHAGPERVGDRLNGNDEFFPVLGSDERIRVVSRRNIRWVAIPPHAHGEVEIPGEPTETAATLTLVDGSTLAGTLRYVAPASRSRVQDYLNDGPRFVPLHQEARILLVNRDHLAFVVFS